MDKTRSRFLQAFLVSLLVAGGTGRAADMPTAKIKSGDKMPNFTLPDVNGKPHSLHDLQGKKAVAVIFIATRCPYSKAFDHVLAKLSQEYDSRGVAFLAINSNKTEPLSEVAEHAKTNDFSFPVLKDEGNRVANQVGAAVTPEVFLLDGTWTLRYHGALGNSQQPTTKPELANDGEIRPALEAVLAGKPVTMAETKAFGCTIKRI